MSNFNNTLKSFVRVIWQGKSFFLPFEADIYLDKSGDLVIDLWDSEHYVIADGVKCHHCLIYNAQENLVKSWPEEAGGSCNYHEYHFGDKRLFQKVRREVQEVVLHYDYGTVTSEFLHDHPELDKRIVAFLKKYPECFGQVSYGDDRDNYVRSWLQFNEWLSLDEDLSDCDELSAPILELFGKFIQEI